MKTTIVDSIMGSGKSSFAIDMMSKEEKNFILITPFLSEIERVKHSIPNKRFYDPKNFGNGKLDSLKKLLSKGKNIASTHALFATADSETVELIESQGYTLILDEVLEVVNPVPATRSDIKLLKDANAIFVNDKDVVHWNDEYEYEDGKFDTLKTIIKNERVLCVDGVFFMWVLPVDVFKCFQEVFVLTYMFDGQVMKSYFDLNKIEYGYKSIRRIEDEFTIVDYVDDKDKILDLINVFDASDKINNVGKRHYDLSKSWYDKSTKARLDILKNNIYNFFQNKMKAKSSEVLWTTFLGVEDDEGKNYYNKVKGKGFSSQKCFAPCNCRATNEYRDRKYLAYTVNRFMNPYIKRYFINKDIEVNENMFALSEMLQWIFRSAVRENNPIVVYIPSKRMRNLLLDWKLNVEIEKEEVNFEIR